MHNHSLPREVAVALVGTSEAVLRARTAAEEAAKRRAPLLLTCEPGCRPREVAEFIHLQGGASRPLVAFDCRASDAAEIERMLFGDSTARPTMLADLEPLGQDSLLLAAGAGTLFIDSIDDLPAAAQRRLVRLLRDGEARTGDHRDPVAIGCRVIASAPADLAAHARNGRFRQDLYRRLSANQIVVPPLRQRPGDLAAIIDALVTGLAGSGVQPRTFTQPALTVLSALHWTDNIDELANLLPRILRHAGPVVQQEDVLTQLPIDGAFMRPDLTASLREARHRFEREYIAAVLERHQWRMVDAARTLGIERANLYRKTRQLGIARATRVEPT